MQLGHRRLRGVVNLLVRQLEFHALGEQALPFLAHPFERVLPVQAPERGAVRGKRVPRKHEPTFDGLPRREFHIQREAGLPRPPGDGPTGALAAGEGSEAHPVAVAHDEGGVPGRDTLAPELRGERGGFPAAALEPHADAHELRRPPRSARGERQQADGHVPLHIGADHGRQEAVPELLGDRAVDAERIAVQVKTHSAIREQEAAVVLDHRLAPAVPEADQRPCIREGVGAGKCHAG